MTITASAAQVNATPVQTQPTSTTVTTTPLLINGASFGANAVATADEILFVSQPAGTIQADSTLEIQVSPNGTNFGVVFTFTNAQIVNTRGAAAVVKVGVGNTFRAQFIAGSTTGAGNGVTVRFRN